MMKLFRKIRYKLLDKNKTGRYLKYAIGEIILVVIGILIALQFNEWNNDRHKKKAEQVVLIQIKSDLEKSQLELQEMKAYHFVRATSSAKVLRSFWKNEMPSDSIVYYLGLSRSTINYSPILGNLKSLINSGNIDLISSKELKNDLVSYVEKVESQLKDLRRIEESYFRKGVEITDEIMPNVVFNKAYYMRELEEFDAKNIPSWYDLDLSIIPLESEDIIDVPFTSDLNELFQNKSFFNGYKKLWTHQFNSYRIYDDVLVITDALLEQLNHSKQIHSK